MNTKTTSLGELITLFYDEYFALYQDEELASIAAAVTINDLLAQAEVSDDEALADAA
jgi:hypothetical protein